MIGAFRQLMHAPSGPGSSEYARIAQLHADFCHHGQESFPAWHRAYALELERALQAADRARGGDGRVALPYWDWTSLRANEGMPRALRDAFGEMPADLVDASTHAPLAERGYTRVHADSAIYQRLGAARAAQQAAVALQQPQHWQHASTRWRGSFEGNSVEAPHNAVHNAVGFPMTSTRCARQRTPAHARRPARASPARPAAG